MESSAQFLKNIPYRYCFNSCLHFVLACVEFWWDFLHPLFSLCQCFTWLCFIAFYHNERLALNVSGNFEACTVQHPLGFRLTYISRIGQVTSCLYRNQPFLKSVSKNLVNFVSDTCLREESASDGRFLGKMVVVQTSCDVLLFHPGLWRHQQTFRGRSIFKPGPADGSFPLAVRQYWLSLLQKLILC